MATVDAIIAGKYPAKAHARRVAQQLATHAHGSPAVIYLEAQKTRMIEDNDEPMPFRYAPSCYYSPVVFFLIPRLINFCNQAATPFLLLVWLLAARFVSGVQRQHRRTDTFPPRN